MVTIDKLTNAKVEAIRERDLSWLDKQYLTMLVDAIRSGSLTASRTAKTKIDEWYAEV